MSAWFKATAKGVGRRFAAWRAAVWLRKAKRALRLHDWWRARAGEDR